MRLKRWNCAVMKSSVELERENSGATTSYFNRILMHSGCSNKTPLTR